MSPAPARTVLGHPAGLATVFLTEMWERLSFYGMRALLILFLVDQVAHGGLALSDRTAAAIYGLYVGGTYLACLPGGWIGDRVSGCQRAVLYGGIAIALGHLILGVAPTASTFYFGLFVIVIGTGLLKPNAGAIVAQLYPEGGARRDAGFTIYYIGVNIGATLGPLIAGLLAQRYGWPAGFMTASVGMALGVLQFLWGRRLLGSAGAEPSERAGHAATRSLLLASVLLAALVALVWTRVVPIAPIAFEHASTTAVIAMMILYFAYLLLGAGLTRIERRRIYAVMVLFGASVLFWAGYEQTGSSLNLFAERYTDRHVFGWDMPASWLQSLNPIYIVLFGPLLSWLWLELARRRMEPSTTLKFVAGLMGMASGFAVMAVASRLVVGGHRVGLGWLSVTFLLHTWGELALSPVGLSAVSKLVPPRFVSQSLGVFFVSLSVGNLLAGRIAGGFAANELTAMPGQFMFIFWFGAITAAALIALLPLMRRWSAGAN